MTGEDSVTTGEQWRTHDPLHPAAAGAPAAADGDLLLRHLRHHPGAAGRLPDGVCRHAGLVGLVDLAGADRGVARPVRARPAVDRAIPPVGAAPAARQFRPVAGVPAAQRRPDRRADRADAGARPVLLLPHLGDRHPGRHLLGDPSALDRRPHPHRRQLCRRRHAQLHAGADPDVGRLRLFRP